MPTVRLSDICTLRQWKALPAEKFTQQGYPVYGANGIIGRYHSYNHEHPVIAITCRGDSCGTVTITQPQAYVTANAICVEEIRADILPLYLYYFIKSADLTPYISGAAQPQITQHNLGNLPVPLCSQARQQYIIERLQKTEHILALRNRQLHTLQQLKESFFLQAINTAHGDKVFPRYKLGDIAHIQCGKKNVSAAEADGAYPFFSCAKTPRRINSYSFDGEYLILSGNIDFKLTYYHGKFDAYQRTYIIESRNPELLHLPYLHAFMQQYLPTLRRQAVGGVVKYVRRHMLTDIQLPLPDAATQRRIGSFSLRLMHLEHDITTAIEQQNNMVNSMLQRFFAL